MWCNQGPGGREAAPSVLPFPKYRRTVTLYRGSISREWEGAFNLTGHGSFDSGGFEVCVVGGKFQNLACALEAKEALINLAVTRG